MSKPVGSSVAGLIDAARSGGALFPTSTPIVKAIWAAVSVSDPDGEVQTVKGAPLPDSDLRDYENVPLNEDVEAYFAREVLPPSARWKLLTACWRSGGRRLLPLRLPEGSRYESRGA